METLDIPLPASHPAGHGLLRIRGTVVDGAVEDAEVVTGLMHRGAEKLFESRDYRQILSLANRHDWLSSFDGGSAPPGSWRTLWGSRCHHALRLCAP